MLDIKFIRENTSLVKEAVRKKHLTVDIDRLVILDDQRLELLKEVEEMRASQNEANQKISQAGENERGLLISEMSVLKDKLQIKEAELKDVMHNWKTLMIEVPNLPDMSVPEGESDEDNVELKIVGDLTKFEFEPKSHIEIMTNLNMVDIERGAKVSGFRGYFLKNAGLRLTMALWQLALDLAIKKGYEPIMAPSLVRREPFMGTGYLPQGEEDLYKTQDGDFLSGTAEVPIMGYLMDEILKIESLPKKFIGFSPCFRREAGSHGKDVKGLIRVHEFFKIEQVVLCEATHTESIKWHEELLEVAEEYMQLLAIPYRVVTNCTGDLGLGQVKKYDIEAWVPKENKYRETHSISYFHDFQTRRLNLKYKDENNKSRFAHSLNGTLAATPRLLVSLIENYQQADGSIIVPDALRKYLGQDVIKPESTA